MDSKNITIPKGLDSTYRYKRHEMKASYIGGGLKTKIDNLSQVAYDLLINPEYIIKFIGYEIGSQIDEKTNIINGKQTLEKLEELLERFIGKYILCPDTKCKKPEIKILIEDKKLVGKCTACSKKADLDNKHKMASYILKNPPTVGVKINEEYTVKPSSTEIKQSTSVFKPDVKAIKTVTKAMNDLKGKELDDYVSKLITDGSVNMSSTDCKYLVILNGLYDSSIYERFEERVGVLKFVITNDKCGLDEISYHIYAALCNMIFSKYNKTPEVKEDLLSKVSSLFYLFYVNEIFTERFIYEKLIKGTMTFNNFVHPPENDMDKEISERCGDFIHWFKFAPYEDEDGEYKKEEVIVKSIKEEIDDL